MVGVGWLVMLWGISGAGVAAEPPPLAAGPRSAHMVVQMPTARTPEEWSKLPYPESTYLGASVLQLDPMFVHAVQHGLELLYLRQYDVAVGHLTKTETTFPGTAIGSVGATLVWQARMLENFDFRYDKQYWDSSKVAKKKLQDALSVTGAESWEHLALAAIVGIESIHTMRQANYLSALQLAFQAIGHIESCRSRAPTFVDLLLADGMYNYWRTVVTQSSKILPDFGDHRQLGIEQMERVQREGIFMRPLASLALAYVWMEERQWGQASQACAENRRAFPNNVINNMICGQIYVYAGNYTAAEDAFARIMDTDPANARVHYLRGWMLLRQKLFDEAEIELTTYLSEPYLETWQRSGAEFRLGQIAAERKQYAVALEHWQAAVKLDGHKAARAQIAALEQQRREGKITWPKDE